MIRKRISVECDLYDRAKRVARQRRISLAELCRQGLEAMVARELTDQPWMRYAGIVEGRPDDSVSVDEVVYGRDRL